MDFWQQYQGFLWVGLLVVIVPAIGYVLSRRAKRYQRGLIAQSARANDPVLAAEDAANSVAATGNDLSTVLLFPVNAATMTSHLTDLKLPWTWIQSSATQWQVPLTGDDPTPAAIVVLEDTPSGSRLAVTRADQVGDRVSTLGEWKKIRESATKAARSAGITATEGQGPALAIVGTVDTAGTALAATGLVRSRWERVSS